MPRGYGLQGSWGAVGRKLAAGSRVLPVNAGEEPDLGCRGMRAVRAARERERKGHGEDQLRARDAEQRPGRAHLEPGLVPHPVADGPRGRDRVWSRDSRDFALDVEGAEIGSERFNVEDVTVRSLRARRAARDDDASAGVPGIDGRRGSPRPIRASRASARRPIVDADRAARAARRGARGGRCRVRPRRRSTHFRAGADWREPGWHGPAGRGGRRPRRHLARHAAAPGRASRSRAPGSGCRRPATARAARSWSRSATTCRRRGPRTTATTAALRVDWTPRRDLARPVRGERRTSRTPAAAPAARRAVDARRGRSRSSPPSRLRRAATATSAWQFHRYLVERRLAPYPQGRRRSTPTASTATRSPPAPRTTWTAPTVAARRADRQRARRRDLHPRRRLAGALRRLGARLARAPRAALGRHAEFRAALPGRRVRGRARGDRADAARPVDEPDALQPGARRPTRQHPEWACTPVGHGPGGLQHRSSPTSGSNEAGIGAWGPAAHPAHRVAHPRRRSSEWGVALLQVRLPRSGSTAPAQGDLYELPRRVRRDARPPAAPTTPSVTFQIDETNDYRLFPFESVAARPDLVPERHRRRPTGCCTTSGTSRRRCPAFALGQHVLGGAGVRSATRSTR